MRNWKGWAAWLLFFLVLELPAVFNDTPDDTLSEAVWQITQVSFFWWLLAGFLVWLTAHLLGPKARRWVRTWRK